MEPKDILSEFQYLRNQRTEWELVWKDISKYLLPSRGVFHFLTKKKRRNLAPRESINKTGKMALNVLASGLHSGLTSPVRPWFRLKIKGENPGDEVSQILYQNEQTMYEQLADSSFYEAIHTIYLEYGGFCTAAMFVGFNDGKLTFEDLTAGEYVFSLDAAGSIGTFMRVLFKTYAQIVEMFPEKVSDEIKDMAQRKPSDYLPIIHAVWKEKNGKFNYRSAYVLYTKTSEVLNEGGYYEMPYFVARWEVLSGDLYGTGPGFDSINDVKRLQEMERTISMAAHKSVDPPMNIPARMRGRIDLLPGGQNYYFNPNEVVAPILAINPNFNGISLVVERTELRIQKIFYNDVFLTAVRNPNASPLKAAEVNERSEERLIRLGPVIERFEHEFLSPMLRRVYNLLDRNGLLVELPPPYSRDSVDIDFVSVLAQAQKMVAAGAIQNFLSFIAAASQFEPEIRDVIDADRVAYEYGDITGVPNVILRDPKNVERVRKARQVTQQQQAQMQSQMLMEQFKTEMEKLKSEIARNYAAAGQQASGSLGQSQPQTQEMLPGMVAG